MKKASCKKSAAKGKSKNPAAVALGKKGKGRPKRLSPAALEQRRANAALIQRARQQARDDTHFSAPIPPPEDDGLDDE